MIVCIFFVARILEENSAIVPEQHLGWREGTTVVYLSANRLADLVHAVEVDQTVSAGR